MVEEGRDIYEDRAAGFRLVYKHGRYDPTAWTMIYNEVEYKESLIDFFRMIEPILISACQWEKGKELIPEMIEHLVDRMNEPLFMESASLRMAMRQKERTKEYGVAKPWAYISGGNLQTLVKCYFMQKNELEEVEFFPEKPVDLLVHLIETFKDLPYEITSQFEKEKFKGMLVTNQVHAFSLKPGFDEFVKAWSVARNTFTYVRDEIIEKSIESYKKTQLTSKAIEKFNQIMKVDLPLDLSDAKQLYILVNEKWPESSTLFEELLHNYYLRKGAPKPFVFADSNWGKEFFAFVVNPISYELEVWLTDGNQSKQIQSWKTLFDKKKWVLFINPSQFIGFIK